MDIILPGKTQDEINALKQKEIEKFNFKIMFHEPTWVIKQEGGGFAGQYRTVAVQVKGKTEFGVLSVENHKKQGYSNIWVWSDNCADGQNCHFLNVPNALFKRVEDEE